MHIGASNIFLMPDLVVSLFCQVHSDRQYSRTSCITMQLGNLYHTDKNCQIYYVTCCLILRQQKHSLGSDGKRKLD